MSIKAMLGALGALLLIGIAAIDVYPEHWRETVGFMIGVVIVGIVMKAR